MITEIRAGLVRYQLAHGLDWMIVGCEDPTLLNQYREEGRLDFLIIRKFGPEPSHSFDPERIIWCQPEPPSDGRSARIWFDDFAVGKMAVAHLLQQGYRDLACMSQMPTGATIGSRWAREHAFRTTLRQRGMVCSTRDEIPYTVQANHDWLKRLPNKAGVFCHEDRTAFYLLNDLFNMGRSDVGVLGVGDFLPTSGLSSIRISWSLLGFQIGRYLHVVFSGGTSAIDPVPPLGIIERASTRTATPSWIESLQTWIAHAPRRRCRVEHIAAHLGISRSTLNRRFRKELNQDAQEWLLKRRLGLVFEHILTHPNESIADIAARFGYYDGPHLNREFRKAYDITPGAMATGHWRLE